MEEAEKQTVYVTIVEKNYQRKLPSCSELESLDSKGLLGVVI